MPNAGLAGNEPSIFHPSGLINSAGSGRTDIHSRDVPANGFVVPADVVSGLAEGNTAGGSAIINRMMRTSEASPVVKQQKEPPVPVIVAGGEVYINPEDIERKFGTLERGHKILRQWVIHRREKNIKELKKLPHPKK